MNHSMLTDRRPSMNAARVGGWMHSYSRSRHGFFAWTHNKWSGKVSSATLTARNMRR